MNIISTDDLLNGKYKIQVGVDKNSNPIFVGDILVEDVSYEFPSNYWDGMDGIRSSYPVTKETCKGQIYRKVKFNGTAFKLIYIKTVGYLPKGDFGEYWADKENLKKHKKAEITEEELKEK